MDWKEKWKRFRDGEVKEARYLNKNNLQLTPEETELVKSTVPDTLYHVTTADCYEKAVESGFLGFNYISKKAMSARRGYQPKGVGIFLAGSPRACLMYGGKTFRDNWRDREVVMLSVSKSKLNLDKLSLDLDVMTDLLGLDNTDREDLSYFEKSFRNAAAECLGEFSYHYAGKISISDMKTVGGNFKRALKQGDWYLARMDDDTFNSVISDAN